MIMNMMSMVPNMIINNDEYGVEYGDEYDEHGIECDDIREGDKKNKLASSKMRKLQSSQALK